MFNKISNIEYDINLNNRPIESKNIFRFAYIIDSYKDDPKNYLIHTLICTFVFLYNYSP